MTYNKNDRAPLSFHAVSFGPENRSAVLRRMVGIAQDAENHPQCTALNASMPSSYSKALDTVSAEWFQPSEIDNRSLGPADGDIPRVG
jgi:hypothetical protein